MRVIVVLTRFSHGAWLVIVAIQLSVSLMFGIKRHYNRTDARWAAPDGGVLLLARVYAVVLVSKLNAPALQALAYARATRPSSLVGLHVELDAEGTHSLEQQWLRASAEGAGGSDPEVGHPTSAAVEAFGGCRRGEHHDGYAVTTTVESGSQSSGTHHLRLGSFPATRPHSP